MKPTQVELLGPVRFCDRDWKGSTESLDDILRSG